MSLKRVSRTEQFLKIGISGPSGSGKTYSSLRLAHGLMGSFEHVAVLDTEGGSASLYSDLGDYMTQEMKEPFGPDRYVKAIEFFQKEGVKCMIIDSASHEWDGPGGCLDIHQRLGGKFPDWAKVTPMHKAFVEAINKAQMHVITTTRRKQDYVLEENSKGKMQPKKVGLKEVQRDGFEYELTVSFDVDISHYAQVSKDRTSIFKSDHPFLITEKVGEALREWNSGKKASEIEYE